jgi:hypothetical protein
VAIEKHTQTLVRINRCPVTQVVEYRVQLPHPSYTTDCDVPLRTERLARET